MEWNQSHVDLRCRFGLWDSFGGWNCVCALGSGHRTAPTQNPAFLLLALPCISPLLPQAQLGSWSLHPDSHSHRHGEQTHCPLADPSDPSFICRETLPDRLPGHSGSGQTASLPAAGRRMRCRVLRTSLGHWHPPAPLGTPVASSSKRQDPPAKKKKTNKNGTQA